jgi:hypothetical protein
MEALKIVREWLGNNGFKLFEERVHWEGMPDLHFVPVQTERSLGDGVTVVVVYADRIMFAHLPYPTLRNNWRVSGTVFYDSRGKLRELLQNYCHTDKGIWGEKTEYPLAEQSRDLILTDDRTGGYWDGTEFVDGPGNAADLNVSEALDIGLQYLPVVVLTGPEASVRISLESRRACFCIHAEFTRGDHTGEGFYYTEEDLEKALHEFAQETAEEEAECTTS